MANLHLCRDSFGYFNASIFQLWTCSMCYYYLFPESTHLQPNWDKNDPLLVGINSYNNTTTDINIVPNISNPTNALNVCNFLDRLNCDRWKGCCQSAVKCCSNNYLLVTFLSVDVEREETASHTKLVVQTHGVQDTHQMSNVQ